MPAKMTVLVSTRSSELDHISKHTYPVLMGSKSLPNKPATSLLLIGHSIYLPTFPPFCIAFVPPALPNLLILDVILCNRSFAQFFYSCKEIFSSSYHSILLAVSSTANLKTNPKHAVNLKTIHFPQGHGNSN